MTAIVARRGERAGVAASLAALALSSALALSCASPPPPPPGVAAPPPAASVAPPPFVPGAMVAASPAPPSRFDPQVPASPLADARLAAARTALQRGARAAAAREVEVAREKATDLDPATHARWGLLAAVLRRDAGDPGGAATAFEKVASASALLAPAARVEAAALHLASGRHAAALATLEAIAEPDRTSARFAPLHAEALIRAGDPLQGAAVLEAWMARLPRPPGWATTALRLLGALAAKPGPERAATAARIARLVASSANGNAAAEALALAARLAPHPAGSLEARVAHARSKLRAGDQRAAVTLLDRAAKADTARATGEVGCELWRLRGEALGEVKRRAEAADALGVAADRCAGTAVAADALFAAGKASARADRSEEASQRYERFEREHAAHRLADDARVERVRALIQRADLAAAAPLAKGAAATYPNGDIAADASFLLALAHMNEGRWAEAVPLLELSSGARERSYERAGRFGYYLGRAREVLGDLPRARAAYEAVVIGQPVSFYGALAHARLEEIAPGAGKGALDEARRRAEASPPIDDPTEAELASGGLARAAELVAVGDAGAAEAELDGLGLAARSASPGLRWAAARLLVRLDPVRAHAVLRGATESEARAPLVELDRWVSQFPAGPPREAWALAFPRPFAAAISAASSESGTPEPLLFAIMREESAFSPVALSRAGARGLLQLMPATARTMARPLGLAHDEAALETPAINARLGARFLAQLRERFAHAPLLAIPAYNAGPLAVERWCRDRPDLDFDLWVEAIPYRETRLYTKRVFASLAAYEALGGAGTRVYRTPRRACAVVEEAGGLADDAASPEP